MINGVKRSQTGLVLGCFLLFGASELFADELVKWRSEAQLGFVDSRSEQRDRSINGRLHLQADTSLWRNTTRAQLLHTKTDNKTSKENYLLSHQLDYQWTPALYSLASGRYEYKRFASFGHQYDLLTGLGYRVLHSDASEWSLEVGLGMKFTERSAPPYEKDQNLLKRAASKFASDLTETIRFHQEIIYDDAEESREWRLLHSLAVRANAYFSMSLSHEWKRMDEVQTDRHQLDTITSLNLVFNWNGKQ